MTTTEAGAYSSMVALRAANLQLSELRRSQGDGPELFAAIETFLSRGSATGAILSEEEERWSAQSLLDYWAATIDRAGIQVPVAILALFDPLLAPELPDTDCPYLGLDSFDEANADLFFGRRRVVADLIDRLPKHRLLAVVGPSGSGKSSLVRAGLLPTLRTDGVPGSAGWQILLPIVPGSDPCEALERTLVMRNETDAPLFLLIDQFEETFTLCTDEMRRREFLARIVALATGEGAPHRVVLTMRSDFEPFIARAEALQPLYEAGKVTLPPLTVGELREAIEQPAEHVGLKFEAGVVDFLLGDILGEPAALPLLQYSLRRLWETRERNRVTLAAYKQVGGGRLALAKGADAVYASLIPEEQVTAKRMLLRLVRPGEGLEVTSNRIRRSYLDQGGEDPGRIDRVVTKLLAARLIRLSQNYRDEDTQVEIAHEALVRNWPTLVEWLEDERIYLRQRQRLTTSAEQWDRLNKSESALLRGALLHEALQFDDLTQLDLEFVTASRAAEEQQQAYEQRKNRLIRRLAIVASVVSIITLVLALIAWRAYAVAQQSAREADQQRLHAEDARQLAERLALASAAQSQAQVQPELALLLAYEAAAQSTDEAEAQQLLRDVLNTTRERIWIPVTLLPAQGDARGAAFNVDGTRILLVADSTVQIMRSDTQRIIWTAQLPSAVRAARFSRDERYVLALLETGKAYLWDITQINSSGGSIQSIEIGSSSNVIFEADFSPDGKILVTAHQNGRLRLWNIDQSSNPITLSDQIFPQDHMGAVVDVAFDPSGTRLVSASSDNTARIWDVDSKKTLYVLRGHSGAVYQAHFSPDGSRILTASADGTARLWDVATGKAVAVLSGHRGAVYTASFNAIGTRILTASADGTARLWDDTGALIAVLVRHTGPIYSATFGPGGTRILTASADTTAILWDAKGSYLTTLEGHTRFIRQAIFDPTGASLLTASGDGTIRRWFSQNEPIHSASIQATRQTLLQQVACRVNRSLTPAEIERYRVPTPLQLNLASRRCPRP